MLRCFPYFCFFFLFPLCVCAQNITLSGIVTNEKGNAVPGTSVHILNTHSVAITNTEGSFALKNLPAGEYLLSFEAACYATIQKNIRLFSRDTSLSIQLHNNFNQLDEVTVTAEKREVPLQQLPYSVSALTAKEVENYRLWNSRQLTTIIPSLYTDNPGDGRNITSVRGIVTTSYDPAVATYIDGVNQFSLDTYIGTLTDVERIEVLRGPQGTLYGRNAMGGVINIITKQPTNKTEAFAELNFGNYNAQRYSAGVRFPVIKDKLFAGVSLLYNKRDGYYQNDFTGKSYDKQHQLYGNYYLTFIPAEKWKMTANLKYQANRNNGAFPLVFGREEAFQNPFHLSQDATATMIDNNLNASLVINHSGNAVNISSITSYQNNYRYYDAPLDGDFSPADVISIVNDYGKPFNNVKVFTQELRLSSAEAGNKLQYTAGAYFFYQDNPTKQGSYYGEFANAAYNIGDSLFTIVNTSKGYGNGAALYGQLSYELSPKLTVTGGLRYDYEHRRLGVSSAYEKEGFSFETVPDTSASTSFHAFSPKLNLEYHLTKSNHLYATYSRGYRVGGLSPLPSDPSGPVALSSFKPENSDNYEAGSKNMWFHNKLKVNIAVYAAYINNAQVPTLVLPQAVTLIRNTGKLQTRGIDLEVAAAPVSGLQVTYNAGLIHTEYKSLKIAQNGAEVNLAGKQQIYTPSATSMLAVQYNIGVTDNSHLFIRGEWQYRGKMYFDFANSLQQNGYNLFNAKAGFEAKHIGISVWWRNIFNKKYIAYAYDFGAVHLGDPNTFGIGIQGRL